MNSRTTIGLAVLAAFSALLLWTTYGDHVSTMTLGAAALAAVAMAAGSLLVGTSEDGRTV